MKFLDTEEKKQRRLVHIPMGRFGEATEIAKAALFLASDESSLRDRRRVPRRRRHHGRVRHARMTGDDDRRLTISPGRRLGHRRACSPPPTPRSRRRSQRAVEAQRDWRRVPVAERAAICTRMVEWCVARADELGEELTLADGPADRATRRSRSAAASRSARATWRRSRAAALADIAVGAEAEFQRFIRREPLGVVLVLAPWNYPWLTSVNAVVPALLAGNAVILKMAQQTPLVAERYAEAFTAAGLPEGVFQYPAPRSRAGRRA